MAAAEGCDTGVNGEKSAFTVQERLTQRHQARLEDAEKRREAKERLQPAEENTDYFHSEFLKEKAAVEELLRACAGASGADGADALERATAKAAQLQKFLNDSLLFLTQYDVRRAQAALHTLQGALADAREDALPKKKFTFRVRTKATEKTPASVTVAPVTDVTVAPVTDGGGNNEENLKTEAEQCEFSHVSDANITKTAEEIERRDVLLTHLRNCRVRLQGAPLALHLRHIQGCEILCGPVSSSVFVDECRDSTLAFPCQQLRVHNTSNTRVYLHVTSRAIVEGCSGVGVAPFTWSYPGLDRDFAASGLDRSRNNWSDVDDFFWLAAETPSPNWSVIPEEERRTTWDS